MYHEEYYYDVEVVSCFYEKYTIWLILGLHYYIMNHGSGS